MPELIVTVNEAHLDEITAILTRRYGASVSRSSTPNGRVP